ncbi:MAG TPA: plastocyanin/azurin family copper-binding protein [Solirubrobacteraceae bacterium]|jgi:plastocyanin|nr:plastocyanin/azurin family copper-binding protein [Solirubrobacteraceae bacterium]
MTRGARQWRREAGTRAAISLLALVAVAAPASALALAGAGAGQGGQGAVGRAGGTHTVVIKGLRYRPGTITIRRGESVRWVWEDGRVEHNVTARGFRSRTQTRGSFTVRFTRAGTFNYHCTIHEGMAGKVVVR